MNPARFSIAQPVTVLMGVLAVLVVGTIGFTQLSVDLLPDISFPVVAVITVYPGAPPEEVEEFVSKPIEEAAAIVEDLESVQSVSSQNLSTVIIEFNWGKDMDWAAFDAREKVEAVIERLPEDAQRPVIMKIDPNTVMPVMTLDVTGMEDMRRLREIADDVIKPELEKLPGVAAVSIYGGLQREIRIEVNWEKLKARRLPIAQVEAALQLANLNVPAGFTVEGPREFTIRTIGEFQAVEDIGELVVAKRGGQFIHLREIAEIKDTHKEVRSYARLNGKPSVSLTVQKQSAANTVRVSDAVTEALTELPEKLPRGVEVSITSDSAEFIRDALHNLYAVAEEGALLAMLIIFLFLATLRGTLVSAISIPLSVLATFILMYFNNMTLNIITMGGLVLAVGRIVDDSVVVLENIYRHLEEGEPVVEAAIGGTQELAMAIAAVTFTTMCVFLPIAFVGGLVSTMFTPMALVVMFGLFSSLIVALTVVPLLSARFLRMPGDDDELRAGGFSLLNRALRLWGRGFERLARWYRRAVAWCLDHRAVVTAVALGVFVVSGLLIRQVGRGFFPEMQSDEMSFTMETELGASVEHTNEVAKVVEGIVRELPELKHVHVALGSSGEASGMFRGAGTGTRTARFTLKLTRREERERMLPEIREWLRERLEEIPGVTVAFEGGMEGGMGAAVEVTISGNELEVLNELGEKALAAIEDVEGVLDLDLNWEPGNPEYHVFVDRDKAGRLGLSVLDIAHTVQTQVRGTQELTKFREAGKEYDITVRARESDRDWVQQVRDTDVVAPDGSVVPLSAVAEVRAAMGPTQISRDERRRSVTVQGGKTERPLSELTDDIKDRLSALDWPEGYIYEVGGSAEDMAKAFGGMGVALALGVLLIYIILASQFESLVHPLVIMLAIPLEVIGVFGALILTQTTMTIMVFLGILMLTGIVVSNAILLVQMINLLRERGVELREAIIEGGRIRLRPILMTAIATVFAMLPLALAFRAGSEMWQPLGITVIGGLITSTFLTLFVVPVAYSLMEQAAGWATRLFSRV